MRCTKMRHYIDLQARLEPEQALVGELRSHLDSCPRCRVRYEQAQKLQLLLSPGSLPEFPTWMHEKIMHQVRTHEPQRVALRRRMRLQTIPAALAVILSIYIGSLVGVKAFNAETSTNTGIAAYQEEGVTMASFGESTIFELDSSDGAYDE